MKYEAILENLGRRVVKLEHRVKDLEEERETRIHGVVLADQETARAVIDQIRKGGKPTVNRTKEENES